MLDLAAFIAANRTGSGRALASVCSAHPDVLAASLRLAETLDQPVLIEATSNQVNQSGGYTGMRPRDFIAFVRDICATQRVDPDRVIFGGDHLGPQVWRRQPAPQAMALAGEMLRDYVAAGFSKIHLDCSEGCADEPAQVGDTLAATRAATLARICEEVAPGHCAYVIGTEVPPPGGARTADAGTADAGITPTSPESAQRTLIAHRDAFAAAGIAAAFGQVRALVVQPGLEFGPDHIDHFDTAAPDHLSDALAAWPGICFEAHSTDYQHPGVYPALAARHFAILKVGPALTFAWREALYALSHIQVWQDGGAHVSQTLEGLMLQDPCAWQGHYPDSRILRHFGYADRIRYYWTHPAAQTATARLIAQIDAAPPPAPPVLAQYLDPATLARSETLRADGVGFARSVLMARVQVMLLPYFQVPA